MPDEIMAVFAALSIFGPKTTFFVDYETSPTILALMQQRNVEYYNHDDLVQLGNLLNAKSERTIIVDGLYEWTGKIAPVNELVNLALQYECFIIGNELNTFGLLGRQGRGFMDLFNLYDAVNMEIGSYSRFLGGFGCYVGAKRFLINKVRENINTILNPLPQFMLSVNLGALELAANNNGNGAFTGLWKNSRYFITRLKQIGFTTVSDTPIAVINMNNNEEACEFVKRLFFERIIVGQHQERVRMCLSIEHHKEDLDHCLGVLESIGKELAILK
jgi:glycine C-acetyltransferase